MIKKILTIGIVLLLTLTLVSATEWQSGVWYNIGDQVTYNGETYECRQSHTSQVGWTPTAVPSLWLLIESPNDNGAWGNNIQYNIGDEVIYNNQNYICRQSHISQMDWIPPNVPALWETNINTEYTNELINYINLLYGDGDLSEWNIIDVDKSIKVITYDIELEHKVTGETRNITWYKRIR